MKELYNMLVNDLKGRLAAVNFYNEFTVLFIIIDIHHIYIPAYNIIVTYKVMT